MVMISISVNISPGLQRTRASAIAIFVGAMVHILWRETILILMLLPPPLLLVLQYVFPVYYIIARKVKTRVFVRGNIHSMPWSGFHWY